MIRPREERWGSSRNLPKSLRANSEPQLTGKTGHQWTQLLLTVSQIVQFCTHVPGSSRQEPLTIWRLDWSNGMLRYSSVSVGVPYTGIHMTWRIGQEVGDHVSPQTEWIVQFVWRLWRIVASLHAAYRIQMRYLGRHGRRVSIQTIRNRLHVSQLKSRKAAQKPLLTAGVAIEFIDDQSCLWAVAHYWHGEILANFCWTPSLFSGPYLSSQRNFPAMFWKRCVLAGSFSWSWKAD